MTKIDLCNRIIEAIEVYRPSNHATVWASDIDKDTAERVITVIQNVVRGVRDSRQNDTSKKFRWMPMSKKRPPRERYTYWVCTNTGYQCLCRWTDDVYGIGGDGSRWGWKVADIPECTYVVAWMELPESYKEEDE